MKYQFKVVLASGIVECGSDGSSSEADLVIGMDYRMLVIVMMGDTTSL